MACERGPEKFTEEERLKGRYGMQLYPYFPSGRFVLKTDWPAEYGRRAWREGNPMHVGKRRLAPTQVCPP